jgi:hypothetical protein
MNIHVKTLRVQGRFSLSDAGTRCGVPERRSNPTMVASRGPTCTGVPGPSKIRETRRPPPGPSAGLYAPRRLPPSLDTVLEDFSSWTTPGPKEASGEQADLVAMLQGTSVTDPLEARPPAEPTRMQPLDLVTGGFGIRFGLTASSLRRRNLSAQRLPAPARKHDRGLSTALAVQDRAIRKSRGTSRPAFQGFTCGEGRPDLRLAEHCHGQGNDDALIQLFNERLRVCNWSMSGVL